MPQRDEDSIAQFPIGNRILTTDNFRLCIGKNVFMHTLQKSLRQQMLQVENYLHLEYYSLSEKKLLWYLTVF